MLLSTDAATWPRWPVHPGERGCSLGDTCSSPSAYYNINLCPECVQWGLFKQSVSQGCVDADLLPVPQSGWVYWLRAAP